MSTHELDPPQLSAAARSLWGKASDSDGAWLPLVQHMTDSGGVARMLMREWVPGSVRRLISGCLRTEPDDPQIDVLVGWLAHVHDIGKATPVFQGQYQPLTGRVRDAGLPLLDPRDAVFTPHSQLSQFLLARWLGDRSWSPEAAASYAVVPGGHHGVTTGPTDLSKIDSRPHIPGHPPWSAVQNELLDFAAQQTGATAYLKDWQDCPLSPQVQAVVSGIVIVADWLASNRELFPYATDEVQGTHEEPRLAADFSAVDRLDWGWKRLGLPPVWRPAPPPPSTDDLFAERFALPPDARVRPVQRTAVDLARTHATPGIMVIEAPMGVGKSEAALAVAEVYAARVGAGGVYVALPTMATSDALFSRVRRWVARLPYGDGTLPPSVFLAHGKAALNEEFAGLARSYEASGVGDGGSDDAIAHWWLSGRKKGALAPFGVGTIDQLLFAGLRSKHLVLRHLGLAGKVVVIDEAHAYDVYMQVFLRRVLAWLGSYEVPVVVLSATLGSRTRRELVAAYDSGRRHVHGLPAAEPATYDALDGEIGYPVISGIADGEVFVEAVASNGAASVELVLERLDDDLDVLAAAVGDAVAAGGCVAVLRNTVARAQETYDVLVERLGDDHVMLAHSRFIACDRAAREKRLRELLGPPGSSERPEGFVVVGTQVLEQSLDIDVDLMVSDLAPTDLLLQRAGRLHRHARPRPSGLERPRLLLTGVVDWRADLPTPVRPSLAVYDPYVMLRTLWTLREHGDVVRLPDDIAGLVERTYRTDTDLPATWVDESERLQESSEAARAKKNSDAEKYALHPPTKLRRTIAGWENLRGPDDQRLAEASVRDAEDTLEVAVLVLDGDEARLLPWIGDGAVVPTAYEPDSEVARLLATCTVRLPASLTRWRTNDVIDALDRHPVPGWQQSRWLRDLPPLFLTKDLEVSVAGHTVRYDRRSGLSVTLEVTE